MAAHGVAPPRTMSRKRPAPELDYDDYKDLTTQDWLTEPVHLRCGCDRVNGGRYHEKGAIEKLIEATDGEDAVFTDEATKLK